MLAQAAKKQGLMPLVIDLFADLDTQAHAKDFRQVASLAGQHLAPALDYFIQRYAATHAVYGSGFEYHPQSLRYLASRLTLLGNPPDTFAKCQDRQAFFSVLDALKIPYPAVDFDQGCEGWLVKPLQGQGGVGIKRFAANDHAGDSVYWQKFQAGTSHSVLFLADGQQVQVVGFNSQWPIRLSEDQEFVFSGVVNSCDLSDRHKAEITGWLKQIVPVFALKGLNSLDFIHNDGCSYVLEINPRPSASMQLYEEDLLVRHIRADRGTLAVRSPKKLPPQTGYQIVYAPRDLIIPDRFDWPIGCMDLPKSGNMCRAGQPLCSIIASQKKESRSVAEQLLTKQQLIISQLERF